MRRRILGEHSIEWLSRDWDGGDFDAGGYKSRFASASEIEQAIKGDLFPGFECAPDDEAEIDWRSRGPRSGSMKIFFGRLDWSRKILK